MLEPSNPGKNLSHGPGTLLISSSNFITTAEEVMVPFHREETAKGH